MCIFMSYNNHSAKNKNIKFTFVSTCIRHWYAHTYPIIYIICNKLLFISVLPNRFTVTWSAVKIMACYRVVKNCPNNTAASHFTVRQFILFDAFLESCTAHSTKSLYKNFPQFLTAIANLSFPATTSDLLDGPF